LKEKRFVLSSLKGRLRSRFNVAVAEVDFQDKWQRSMLAISFVGTDHGSLDGACAKVRDFIQRDHRVQVADAIEEFR
jgi:uncharacterized protein YlxP (DUF503 family)